MQEGTQRKDANSLVLALMKRRGERVINWKKKAEAKVPVHLGLEGLEIVWVRKERGRHLPKVSTIYNLTLNNKFLGSKLLRF